MTFTPTPPDRPGFYAWKMEATDKDTEIDLRKLFTENGTLLDEATLETPDSLGGLWCPLLPAEEVEKAFREGFSAGNYAARIDTITQDGSWKESNARKVVENE